MPGDTEFWPRQLSARWIELGVQDGIAHKSGNLHLIRQIDDILARISCDRPNPFSFIAQPSFLPGLKRIGIAGPYINGTYKQL